MASSSFWTVGRPMYPGSSKARAAAKYTTDDHNQTYECLSRSNPSMADPTQTSQQGTKPIDSARLKAMRDNVEAKYAGTQEALERNKQNAETQQGEGERKGLRAKHMEGIVKNHDD